MTDYSQFGEQAAIGHAFKDHIGTGVFLDIGAYNPKVFSNTRALYELGWSGVMIEPSPGPMLTLIAEYGNDPRITLVQAAISVEGGAMPALHVTDDAVSTTDEANYDQWKGTAKFLGRVLVPGITWGEIAMRFGGADFCNIDAEGISVDVFHAMLAAGIFPTVVCVEYDNRLPELMTAATKYAYAAIYSNGTNVIFKMGVKGR